MNIRPFDTLAEAAEATLPFLSVSTVAFSGGSTYAALFSHWVNLRPQVSETQFFPVDERMVPLHDGASNWGVASEKFLTPLGIGPQVNHHPSSIENYTEILEKEFGRRVPVFDTVFLGIGDDGHTASLFPGSPELLDTTSIVLQTVAPKAPHNRLTIGPIVIASARRIVSILYGPGKDAIAQRVLAQERTLPFVALTIDHPDHTLFIAKEYVAK